MSIILENNPTFICLFFIFAAVNLLPDWKGRVYGEDLALDRQQVVLKATALALEVKNSNKNEDIENEFLYKHETALKAGK